MKQISLASVLLVIGFIGGSIFVGSWLNGQPQAQPVALPRELTSYRDVVKRVLPAVVSIETKGKPGTRPELDLYLPPGLPGDPNRLGFGSGYFADPSGVIVTNFHVVEGADTAVVHLLDGRKYTSKDIRVDRRTDIAVIVLDVKNVQFPFLELGNSDAMEIGDRVLAVGAPFGLAGSVTQGIVSAKGRAGLQMNMYEDFIQTDAAINPGNSGGPLVNLEGRVVGINAAIKSKNGGFQGVGLAVASNLVKNVIHSLRTTGTVKRGYLGVQVRDLPIDVAGRLGLEKPAGLIVADVFPNTPAAKGKLLPGDILIAISGRSVKDGQAMQAVVAGLTIDQATDFDVVRDGEAMRLTVVIEEQPTEFGSTGLPVPRLQLPFPAGGALAGLGIEVADLSDAVAEDLGYRKGVRGVLITRVTDGGAAADAGLRRGMVVSKINQTRVSSAASARDAMGTADIASGIVLQVVSPQGGVNYVLLKR